MSNEKTDWWVGLFILLGAIALSFLALRAGNLSSFSFAPTYALSAKFDNIGGLKVRAPVKSAGVVVGRVASIALDEKTFQAVVTIQIEKNYRFPKDSSAKILTSGLLGEQYIGLEAGGGAPGDGVDRAADGVAPIERALRAAQHLDPVDEQRAT